MGPEKSRESGEMRRAKGLARTPGPRRGESQSATKREVPAYR